MIEHRRKFLRKLVAGGFLTKENAPTEEAKSAFPVDIESLPPERQAKFSMMNPPSMLMMISLQWKTAESQKDSWSLRKRLLSEDDTRRV